MIKLSLSNLDKIVKICEEINIEHFTLDVGPPNGVGVIVVLTYDTIISGYPAKVSVEVTGVDNW